MHKRILIVAGVFTVVLSSGCSLQEVRSKIGAGVEFRHDGGSRSNAERYAVQQGIELAWSNGVKTGATYRRRDVNEGDGDNDNGLWLECSFPLWKAPKKPDDVKERLLALEGHTQENDVLRQQVAELERRLAAIEAGRTTEQRKEQE